MVGTFFPFALCLPALSLSKGTSWREPLFRSPSACRRALLGADLLSVHPEPVEGQFALRTSYPFALSLPVLSLSKGRWAIRASTRSARMAGIQYKHLRTLTMTTRLRCRYRPTPFTPRPAIPPSPTPAAPRIPLPPTRVLPDSTGVRCALCPAGP